uniref:Uncharacterized protein n=1 Tax=Anguilla anguilla TaxID=7936 RepID=A0A0E9WRH0_ANGAN
MNVVFATTFDHLFTVDCSYFDLFLQGNLMQKWAIVLPIDFSQ